MELEETVIAKQRIGKHVHAATNTRATIELLDKAFFVRSVSCETLNM
jgi:hypothetical protein